jgi:microcystin-dependent protein
MSEPFIGQIVLFAGNFAPRGWAFCNGQLISIATNTALFSILGTTYGGNGTTNFALPDLRGRVPMHAGTGPGLTPRSLGELSGSESVTLLSTQIPVHNHPLVASTATPTTDNPAGALLPVGTSRIYAAPGSPGLTAMAPQSVGLAGGSQPHDNLQPFTCLHFIIALEGIFPSRN